MSSSLKMSIAKTFETDQYARQLADNNADRVSGLVLVGGWRWGLDSDLGAIYTSSVVDRLRFYLSMSVCILSISLSSFSLYASPSFNCVPILIEHWMLIMICSCMSLLFFT